MYIVYTTIFRFLPHVNFMVPSGPLSLQDCNRKHVAVLLVKSSTNLVEFRGLSVAVDWNPTS